MKMSYSTYYITSSQDVHSLTEKINQILPITYLKSELKIGTLHF